jgi:hypothetical protein
VQPGTMESAAAADDTDTNAPALRLPAAAAAAETQAEGTLADDKDCQWCVWVPLGGCVSRGGQSDAAMPVPSALRSSARPLSRAAGTASGAGPSPLPHGVAH